MVYNKKWTETDDRILTAWYYGTDPDWDKIAETLLRSERAIKARLNALRLSLPFPNRKKEAAGGIPQTVGYGPGVRVFHESLRLVGTHEEIIKALEKENERLRTELGFTKKEAVAVLKELTERIERLEKSAP